MSTEYIVLARDDSGFWREIGIGSGATGKDVIEDCGSLEAIHVAVPTRSWNPAPLKIEKIERKTWGNSNHSGEGQ